MASPSRALPEVARTHPGANVQRRQHDKPPAADPSAAHAGRLPPKPLPISGSTREGVSPSEITQLRDAVEEDDPEDARRSHPGERRPLQSAGEAGVAIVVGAHVPGGDRGGRPAIASSPPALDLPSVSLHPDHDRTSPALRALRHGPERTIRILVVVIVLLVIALCASLVIQLRA